MIWHFAHFSHDQLPVLVTFKTLYFFLDLFKLHPASVLEPEWILIAGFLEQLIEYPKIIISRIAQIINSGRVESDKMIVKVTQGKSTIASTGIS